VPGLSSVYIVSITYCPISPTGLVSIHRLWADAGGADRARMNNTRAIWNGFVIRMIRVELRLAVRIYKLFLTGNYAAVRLSRYSCRRRRSRNTDIRPVYC